MIIIRLLWAIVTWCIYLCAMVPMMVIGTMAVPLAIELGHYETSRITGQMIYNAPRWLWLWGNDEEGYKPAWYRALTPSWSEYRRMYVWATIRNSVNNLRFVLWLHPVQRAERVHWQTFGNCTLVWQGAFTRLIWNNDRRLNNTAPWFSIGWKYEPEHRDAEQWERFGCGFALRWVRK